MKLCRLKSLLRQHGFVFNPDLSPVDKPHNHDRTPVAIILGYSVTDWRRSEMDDDLLTWGLTAVPSGMVRGWRWGRTYYSGDIIAYKLGTPP